MSSTLRSLLLLIQNRRKYVDHRPKALRIQRSEAVWNTLMEDLATALQEYRFTSLSERPNPPQPEEEERQNSTPVDFPVIDIVSRVRTRRIYFDGVTNTIVTMLKHGLLAATPVNPQYAISIDTLYFYHRLRLRKPSFSVQAFSKFVCDLYKMPYDTKYRDMLSRSFEIYVRLDNIIERRVKKACGMDSENWRVKNACPPCTYKACCQFAHRSPLMLHHSYRMSHR